MNLRYAPYYRIIREVGKGSFGLVYEAIDGRTQRRVAIKTIHPQYVSDPKIRRNCQKEANGYLKLRDHLNIVDLVDFVLGDDAIYIVMEFVDGISLKKYINLSLRSSKSIASNTVRYIFNQVLSAIEFAHQNDIIHLDIKPENILLEGNLNVKVVDFGISKSLNELKDNEKVGTPIYMSPEQIQNGVLDETTDIYSIGQTMLTTVIGKSIYWRISDRDILFDQIMKVPIHMYLKDYPEMDTHLRNLILTATAKEKRDRFSSCFDFRKQLNNY